jgi:hypothetical protein
MGVIIKPDSITTQIADLQRRLRIMENTQRVTSAVGAQVTTAGWGLNLYRMRVYLGSAQSIASSATESVVNVDLAAPPLTFDTAAGWDSINHQYVVRLTGTYFVAGNVSCAPAGAMTWLVVNGEIQVNGVAKAAANAVIGNVTSVLLGTSYNALAYDSMDLVQGDVVTLRTSQQNDAGLSQPLNAHSKSTYLSLHLIST